MITTCKWGLAALFVVAALFFGPFGNPESVRWITIIALGLLAVPLLLKFDGKLPLAVIFALALFAWAALSLTWSRDSGGGATELANGAGLLAIFILVALAPRPTLQQLVAPMAVIIVAGFAVLSVIFPIYYGGTGNENFQSEAFMIAAPLMFAGAGIWGIKRNDHWIPAILMTGVAIGFLAVNNSNLKWLAFIALFLWACTLIRQRSNFAAMFLLLAALNAGLWLIDGEIQQSVIARAELQINSFAMFLASPILGHGIGSFNVVYPDFQEYHLNLFPGMASLFQFSTSNFAGAAHNEYIQILSDYGLVGGLLFGLLGFAVIGRRRDSLDQAALFTLIMAGVLSIVEFPGQVPQTAILIAAAAGIMANGRDVITLKLPKMVTVATPIIAASILGLAMTSTIMSARSWGAFSMMMAHMNAKNYLMAFQWNLEAMNRYKFMRHPRHQLAMTLEILMSKERKNTRVDAAAADRMFEISFAAAGNSNAIQIARIEYLVNANRKPEEAEARMQWLKKNAKTNHTTWMMEAQYALAKKDYPRVIAAAETASRLPLIHHDYARRMNILVRTALKGAKTQ